MAKAAFFDDAWYRVAAVRCALRGDVVVARQRFRGQPWYVVHDPLGNRSHRVSTQAWWLLSQLDGRRTVDAVWQAALAALGDDAPSQVEVVDLLGRLHAADLIRSDRPLDVGQLGRRRAKLHKPTWLRNLVSPLSVRLPMWDCDLFLERTQHMVRPLMGSVGWLMWCAWVLPAAMLALVHGPELAGNLSDRLLAPGNLLGLGLVFLGVKLVHELAHAYAVKVNGGAVHELGVMLLVLAPVPYVDASAAHGVRSRWQRAFIGFAGMWAELALAAGAMYLWWLVEPGILRATLHNIVLVAGLSTVVFNGNPLLKFDGYFILCDLIGMPNLAGRSNEWWLAGMRRHLLRQPDVRFAPASPGERRWLAAYAPLSLLYRLGVMVGIALFVASEYPLIGVALAAVAVFTAVALPLLKGLAYVATSPAVARHRLRAWLGGIGLPVLLVLLAVLVPVPTWVTAQGIVWVPECAEIRALEAGFADTVLIANGQPAAASQPVLRLRQDDLSAELQRLSARVRQLDVQAADERHRDRLAAALSEGSLAREQAALDNAMQRASHLHAAACLPGTVRLLAPQDLPGRYVERGELLGVVEGVGPATVRMAVTQQDVGLVRAARHDVEVLLADRLGRPHAGQIVREVPAGDHQLPSAALGLPADGPVAVDPADPQGRRTVDRVFQFDVLLLAPVPDARVGLRSHVKLRPPSEPVASQVWRRLRQLLLSRLDV